MQATTEKPPTLEYDRGLHQYSLERLQAMQRDYKAAVERGERDRWTVGRLKALNKVIKRREGKV